MGCVAFFPRISLRCFGARPWPGRIDRMFSNVSFSPAAMSFTAKRERRNWREASCDGVISYDGVPIDACASRTE